MDEALPVGVEPFLIDLKWKQVVGVWVRHLVSLFMFIEIIKVDVGLCMQPACHHHRKMPILIPTLHR